MKTDTPEVQAQRAAAYVRLCEQLRARYVECFPGYAWMDPESVIDLMSAEIKLTRHERDKGKRDTIRFDWLESLPCAFTIHRDQPKADSLPPLRERIDRTIADIAAFEHPPEAAPHA